MTEHEQPGAAQKADDKRKEAAKLRQTLTVAKRVARGRLGVVYAAVHTVLARRFAVKVLRPALTQDELVQQRLRHMVREASQVEHQNVVNLVDFGQLPDRRYYITMDFVRGIPLSQVLERDGRLPPERTLGILEQVAEALAASHRLRVVHGDLKPSNVMLADDSDEGQEQVRLIDFRLCPALAGLPDEADPMAALQAYGTVEYLAPEVLSGRNVDARTDIYAFGCLAYRMLTGQAPFVGDSLEVLQAHRSRDPVPPSRRSGGSAVSTILDSIVLRCLEKSPGDRYRSLEEVLWGLRGIIPRPDLPQALEEGTERTDGAVEAELETSDMPLPESPGRLRKLFYDSIYELANLVVEEELATPEIDRHYGGLKGVRHESEQLAAQVELAENRFEDIRRELRERESTLRYAIIDLNLAKSDVAEGGSTGASVADLEFQICELETSLAELERQRRERFEALNSELSQSRDQLKSFEHQMAVRYRRLYAALDEVRHVAISQEARDLYRMLDRCRSAMAHLQPEGDAPSVPPVSA